MIFEILTFSEAEKEYNLANGTLRKYLYQTPDEKQRIKKGVDYRKSGKTWLITRYAMERIYNKKD